MTLSTRDLQTALHSAGFDPGPIDGLPGRRTTAAVKEFQRAKRLMVDGIVGPATIRTLSPFLPKKDAAQNPIFVSTNSMVPWIERALTFLGLLEIVGNGSAAGIRAMWKRSGGWIANFFETKGGDDIPWCGLYVNDNIAVTLPDEKLPKNPLSALAWLEFGVALPLDKPRFGCIGAKKRKGGGHVFFVVGADDVYFYALGGNQSNSVNVTKIRRSEVVGLRWPSTVPVPPYMPLRPWTGSIKAAGSEA